MHHSQTKYVHVCSCYSLNKKEKRCSLFKTADPGHVLCAHAKPCNSHQGFAAHRPSYASVHLCPSMSICPPIPHPQAWHDISLHSPLYFQSCKLVGIDPSHPSSRRLAQARSGNLPRALRGVCRSLQLLQHSSAMMRLHLDHCLQTVRQLWQAAFHVYSGEIRSSEPGDLVGPWENFRGSASFVS